MTDVSGFITRHVVPSPSSAAALGGDDQGLKINEIYQLVKGADNTSPQDRGPFLKDSLVLGTFLAHS